MNGIHGGTTGAGAFAFTDADIADTHTVSASLISASLSSGAVSNDLTSALISAFSSEIVQDSTGSGVGEVNWQFDFPSTFASALQNGDELNASYGVTVTDIHGASAIQNVDVTIIGASDWFHISSTS